ncbi:unnamed protein product [Euphydryas editha]|uniref:Hyaluronidase n=1 Tax=Euphydryas editha TaxID=104508 RepID=A0AAU9UH72_EUPED|nr:unnamed protein product [Euphydryas editha]
MKFLLLSTLIYFAVKCDDMRNNYYVIEMPEEELMKDYKRPFRVYWNVPTFQCKSKKVPFDNLYEKYGIIQNDGDKYKGEKITILYNPESFPAILKNETSGEYRFRNGGVPQEGNLDEHLQSFRKIMEEAIPDPNFDGIGIIDFEDWRPIFRQNFGKMVIYKDFSYEIERKLHSWWPKKWIQAEATYRFETAARQFMQTALSLANQMRPKASWGYYGFPYCFNKACSPVVLAEDDLSYWMWAESSALYPSVYSNRNLTTSQLSSLVRSLVREANRVKRYDATVLPYYWFSYRDGGYMKEKDLEVVLKSFHESNASGFIIWGSSNDVNTLNKCKNLYSYVETVLGPTIAKHIKKINIANDAIIEMPPELAVYNETVTTMNVVMHPLTTKVTNALSDNNLLFKENPVISKTNNLYNENVTTTIKNIVSTTLRNEIPEEKQTGIEETTVPDKKYNFIDIFDGLLNTNYKLEYENKNEYTKSEPNELTTLTTDTEYTRTRTKQNNLTNKNELENMTTDDDLSNFDENYTEMSTKNEKYSQDLILETKPSTTEIILSDPTENNPQLSSSSTKDVFSDQTDFNEGFDDLISRAITNTTDGSLSNVESSTQYYDNTAFDNNEDNSTSNDVSSTQYYGNRAFDNNKDNSISYVELSTQYYDNTVFDNIEDDLIILAVNLTKKFTSNVVSSTQYYDNTAFDNNEDNSTSYVESSTQYYDNTAFDNNEDNSTSYVEPSTQYYDNTAFDNNEDNSTSYVEPSTQYYDNTAFDNNKDNSISYVEPSTQYYDNTAFDNNEDNSTSYVEPSTQYYDNTVFDNNEDNSTSNVLSSTPYYGNRAFDKNDDNLNILAVNLTNQSISENYLKTNKQTTENSDTSTLSDSVVMESKNKFIVNTNKQESLSEVNESFTTDATDQVVTYIYYP